MHQGKITPPGTCQAQRSPCNSVNTLWMCSQRLFWARSTLSIFLFPFKSLRGCSGVGRGRGATGVWGAAVPRGMLWDAQG